MKSIQTKFIILILCCVLISSAVIGGAGIRNAKKVIDTDSAKLMNLQCSEKAQVLDGLLTRIEQSVKTLSVYAIEQLESAERLKTDNDYLEEYTERLESVTVNAANSTDGALAVYIRYNPQFAPPTSGLFWSKTDLNGRFQHLTPTDFSGYSPSDTEHVGWYYIPVKNGMPTWMAPYFNQNIKVQMISYVIPLYKDNEIIGVAGMDIDFSIIEKLVSDIHIYQTGYAFLTDADGNTMYHKDFPFGTPISTLDSTLGIFVSELKNGTSGNGLSAYTINGADKKVAFRTLKNGMQLALTAPIKEIDAEKNNLIAQVLFAIAAITIVFVTLTILMTRRLVRPLRELNIAAKKIADGDLSISLTQPTKDEVGMLADSFQQTVQHLQKYIDYINGLAYRDALTGVKNKTAYQDVERRLEEQMRLGRPEFAIVVMDINGLKQVNDSCGHDFGDLLIIDACKLICKTFKHSPVYRVGGDEFVVVLEGGDYSQYQSLLEQLEVGMADHNKTAHADSKLSIARGIAVYNSETDLVFANVFKRADDAMYQNKAAMKARKNESAGESPTPLQEEKK